MEALRIEQGHFNEALERIENARGNFRNKNITCLIIQNGDVTKPLFFLSLFSTLRLALQAVNGTNSIVHVSHNVI